MKSLQDTYAPHNKCFGCGPANEKGLRIKSFVERAEGTGNHEMENRIVANWTPEPHHQAFPGILNGGICGALLDCHSNWTAAYHLMKIQGLEIPPCTVTAEFNVKLRRPTPCDKPLQLEAHIVESTHSRAIVDAVLLFEGEATATCRGVFIAVKEGHPAFNRW